MKPQTSGDQYQATAYTKQGPSVRNARVGLKSALKLTPTLAPLNPYWY